MLKQVYELDKMGYILKVGVARFDAHNRPNVELPTNVCIVAPPQGLYRAKWTGSEWIEDMSQEEIDKLNKPIIQEPTELEKLQDQVLQLQEYIVEQEMQKLLLEGGIL